jgi:hypothetical protein
MGVDEIKQEKATQDKIIVEKEVILYMWKLKNICDEELISFSIQQGLMEGTLNTTFYNDGGVLVVDRDLYKSLIQEICYSPFSDTFSLFISDREMALTLLHKLIVIFEKSNVNNNKVEFQETEDISIIEITYSQDKYYQEHIKNNIKNILSLKPLRNKIS